MLFDKITTLEKVLLGALIVCLTVIIILILLLMGSNEPINTSSITSEHTESVNVPIILPAQKTYIAAKASIKYLKNYDTLYRKDTVFFPIEPEFVASMDTISNNKDTINVQFIYPLAEFKLSIRESPDTVQTVEKTKYINKETVKEKSNVLMDYTEKIIIFGVGYLIGKSL